MDFVKWELLSAEFVSRSGEEKWPSISFTRSEIVVDFTDSVIMLPRLDPRSRAGLPEASCRGRATSEVVGRICRRRNPPSCGITVGGIRFAIPPYSEEPSYLSCQATFTVRPRASGDSVFDLSVCLAPLGPRSHGDERERAHHVFWQNETKVWCFWQNETKIDGTAKRLMKRGIAHVSVVPAQAGTHTP
jgi:hypothetical protein